MLPDERTTHSNTLPLPQRRRGSGRRAGAGRRAPAGRLPARAGHQRPAPRATPTARSRRRCCTRPTSILIDDRVPPAGRHRALPAAQGQRPHPLRPDDPVRAQRPAAVPAARAAPPAPTRSSRRRPTRRSGAPASGRCCARARCHRALERKQRTQAQRDRRPPPLAVAFPARPQGADGGARRQRRLPGPVRARQPATARRHDFDDSVEDARSVFEQLMASVRTVHRLRPLRDRPAGAAGGRASRWATSAAEVDRRRCAPGWPRWPSGAGAGAPAGRVANGALHGDRELVASRDPEPGHGGAAPRPARARAARSRSPRPTRACASA